MYDLTYERLHYKGFEEITNHPLDGLAWYKDGVIDVLLQQWDETMSTDMVLEECQRIREMVSERGGNPWNTYYLLCSHDDELDDEKVYLIEHNAFSVRKYVVRSEYDLNRVPFLDVLESAPTGISGKNVENEAASGIVKHFIDYIIENEGTTVRYSKDEVENAIRKIMLLKGGESL